MPRPPRRRPWAAIAVSASLHALLLAFGWIGARMPELPRRAPQFIVLAPPAESPVAREMRYQTGRRPEGESSSDRVGERRMPRVERRRPDRPAVVPEPEALPETPVDTGSAPAAPAPPERPPLIGRIGPGLADGRLWVRPLPLPPRELAQRLKKSHTELVDSAVTAIVQGYLDSIASDPGARQVGLPDWTTNIAGKKFGLDSKNIYIAGLKIPAAVLALLPITSGNVDQNRAYNHLMEMRTDLIQAGQRAQNLDEFKQIIRDIRERKEREREFERNQRTAPPPEEPGVP
jgi:hypothetical protein